MDSLKKYELCNDYPLMSDRSTISVPRSHCGHHQVRQALLFQLPWAHEKRPEA